MSGIIEFLFGGKPSTNLPARVLEKIERQQMQSEILIGWMQLLLVCAWSVLFALAPQPAEGHPFQPVPWALGAYILFTVIRLGMAYRSVMPSWILFVSVIVDITILMVLIWSFHIQYMQPAPFYLKAPTLLYVFIFISLRALRFDPIYVLVAGITAAAAWSYMLFYALSDPFADTVITRDYVEYVTSDKILIGGEVDKILSILMVTFVLFIALVRARRTMTTAIADHSAVSELSRFVSPEIASRITRADKVLQPGDAEVKVATVMFTDIEGFSTISEKVEPEELVALLNDYFTAVAEVIDDFGGTIVQFEGDAMLVAYNTVTEDGEHAASALQTALGIQELMASRRFGARQLQIRTRCGINTGLMTAGAVGSPERLLFTVHGDEVNIAARLEQLNKDYGTYIMLTGPTMEAAGQGLEFDFTLVDKVVVRGRTRPTEVYTVARAD
ncbi:MAG: adenylate/guanylate cyclase domain-containing protein [Rhodospirillales bacterium]